VAIPYVRQPLAFPAQYEHGPDSFVHAGVPAGTLHEYRNESSVFPGTRRRFWAHVPAQYTPAEPAALMVFQDAEWYMDLDFEVRAPVVLDNLIHKGEMPVAITVFVEASDESRNAEYDAFDDTYARFLLDEIVPAVRAEWAITDDPSRWAVCGGSSSGNCAFTVAWFRPERFQRVLSLLAAFQQIPGGNPYPELIRATPPKPLRIFMLAATQDINWGPDRNSLKENLLVAAALSERDYDFRLVLGDGGHDGNHGGVILPDALRWLWRD
jgi:enterochelin esterase-like enzyme